MQMYPAYKPLDVLEEYAITFFSLLNEGYRMRYRHYLMMVSVISAPNMKEEHRKSFIKQLEWAGNDPSDILGTDTNGDDGIDDLKKMFRKL